MTTLYNLRILAPNRYSMAKFDSDFNLEACYTLEAKGSGYTCDCPANNRTVVLKPCKHKRMMPVMLGAVNTDRFYDPEMRSWCQPLGERESDGLLVSTHKAIEEAVAREAPLEGLHKPDRSDGLLSMDVPPKAGNVGSPPLTIASYVELPEGADVAEEFSKLLATQPKQPLPASPLPATSSIRRR